MVKKNPFTTSSQKKNTLLEVCVSLSVYDQDKTLLEQIQSSSQGANRDRFSKKTPKKSQTTSGKLSAEIKINLYQNDRKKKVWRKLGTAHDPEHTILSVKHSGAV